jgi:Protein of unknown function (DUF2997)
VADRQKMQITILPNGEVSIQVLCVPGPACESVSAALEESLGTVKSKQRTAEYYQEPLESEEIAQKSGT